MKNALSKNEQRQPFFLGEHELALISLHERIFTNLVQAGKNASAQLRKRLVIGRRQRGAEGNKLAKLTPLLTIISEHE